MSIDGGLKLILVREHLLDIPDCHFPNGYSLQWYLPGMENDWLRIHEKAEKYQKIDFEKYEKEFSSHKEDLRQRQCFIMNDRQEFVGTGTAWFDTLLMGEGYGRVHWVAIIPEEQGKKLSNYLLFSLLQKLKILGYRKAYLTTSTKRESAICLYLKFGFLPLLEDPETCIAWTEYLLNKKKNE